MTADYTRDSQHTPNSRENGLSFIEILVVISLLSLLITLSLPNLSSLNKQQQHRQAASQLEQLIKLAREQAIYLQSTVILCPSSDQTSCQDNWQQPLMLFLDNNQNNLHDHDEPLLARFTSPLFTRSWNRGNALVTGQK